MTTTWIIALVAIAIALVILFVVLGLRRRSNKKVSFTAAEGEKTKQLTQQEKSGDYQAVGGFQFSSGGDAQKQPVVLPGQEVAQPKEQATEAAAEVVQEPTVSVPEASEEPLATEPVEPQPAAEAADAASDEDAPAAAVRDADNQEAVPADDTAYSEQDQEDSAAQHAELVQEPSAQAAEQEEAEAAPAPVAESVASVDEATETESTAAETTEPAADASPEVAADKPAPEADAIAAAAGNIEETKPEAATPAEQTAPDASPSSDTLDEQAKVADAPVQPAETVAAQPEAAEAQIEDIEPVVGRLGKLRGRLSRSQNVFGQAVLGMLTAGDLDEDAWEEIEDQLIAADLGVKITMNVVEELRDRIAQQGVGSEDEARAMLRDVLIKACKPELDRSIHAMPYDGKPAVILVVGVNGTGKTTTTGKLARVLVSMGHSVVLGAADTFRAAAADQLETWGRRVGATTVRGAEGADPASVAFDAVSKGVEQGADVVLIDTAGRLHNSANLMDQLGKVKRVVEKKAKVDEVLLVLDATTGQNGMIQARTFADVVQISGVVLTKLDGSAKGGIVFQVQEELGVPVKLVGLGEGADHLAPFEVEGFVDALLK